MNSGSSRAHTICQLEYTRTNLTSLSEAATEKTAIINLVDLAGSERTGEAGTADNHTRMKESVNINKSLTALGQCIRFGSVATVIAWAFVRFGSVGLDRVTASGHWTS